MLKTNSLSIGYHHQAIISRLNLQLKPAEMVCLIGPNGSGKSTLLKTLAGMLNPIDGQVELNGMDLQKFPAEELAKQMAIVLTGKLDVGNLSAYALVSLGRHPYTNWRGNLDDHDIEVIQKAMIITGSDTLAHRPVNELSDGERQRVMIARALAQEPKILLLDEPTAFLDLPRRVDILLLLKRLTRETNCVVLLATHDLDLALSITDQLWLMNDKGDFFTGMPEELVLDGSLEATFVSEGVKFDPSNGLFKVHQQTKGQVSLDGEGITGFWTKKALERIGYTVIGTKTPLKIHIIAYENGKIQWKLCSATKEIQFSSLSALIEQLKQSPIMSDWLEAR